MINRLVILPCHSIWKPQSASSTGDDRSEWSLVSFQIEGYDHLAFKEHITRSIEYVKKDANSQLVISGGQTKAELGPVSEAYSFYELFCTLNDDELLLSRITTEEFARDSFENVLFLVCRFYEVHGYYPEHITVIGFEFKRDRFVKHHLGQALNFPEERIEYIGNAPDPKDLNAEQKRAYFEDLKMSEAKFAVEPFKIDWFGRKGSLKKKRDQRNPFNRFHGYASSNKGIAPFINATLVQEGTDEEVRELLKPIW